MTFAKKILLYGGLSGRKVCLPIIPPQMSGHCLPVFACIPVPGAKSVRVRVTALVLYGALEDFRPVAEGFLQTVRQKNFQRKIIGLHQFVKGVIS